MLVKATKVAQWGNSAAVRLSTAMLEETGLHVDDAVEVVAKDSEIIICRPCPRFTLDELLAKFDPQKHRHAPMLDDKPVGIETR